MPPAISDDEMESDGVDVPDSIPAKGKIPTKANEGEEVEAEAEDEDEDEEEDEGEDEFSVEKIIHHVFTKKGIVLYQVKWLGYDKKGDLTWEPVENLENALEILDRYHEAIGGPPTFTKKKSKRTASTAFPPAVNASGNSTKKRSRKSQDTNGTTTTSSQREKNLPDGDWEALVQRVQSIVEETDDVAGGGGGGGGGTTRAKGRETGTLIGLLEWNDGRRTQHSMEALRRKVPQKLLDYYEGHLIFRQERVEDA